MKGGIRFLKTTLLGGLLFLIPFVVITAILGKAISLMMLIAEPVDKLIPGESVAGIALVNIIVVVIVFLVCFAAGMFARSIWGKKLFEKTDNALSALPPYAVLKEQIFVHVSDEHARGVFKPVLATFDDHSMIAFEVERSSSNLVTVYLPGAPDPWSGSVAMVESERVTPLNTDNKAVSFMLKKMGLGAAKIIAN